jgi:integrase
MLCKVYHLSHEDIRRDATGGPQRIAKQRRQGSRQEVFESTANEVGEAGRKERRPAKEGRKTMSEQKRERGTGRWFMRGSIAWIQFYNRGRQIRQSTGIEVHPEGAERDADIRKVEKILRKQTGAVANEIYREPRRLSYEDLRAAFFKDYQAQERKSLQHTKKEREPYLPAVNRLDAFFAGWRTSDIDADAIRIFTAEQRAKGLANGSINRSISCLRRMFHLAVEDEKLHRNDVPHFPLLKEAKPRRGFFEPAEYEALLGALPGYLRLPLALGYFTGMREGEVLGLNWDQIDFLGNAITLRPGETKNDEGRIVPLIPQLLKLVLEQHARRQNHCPYVCYRFDRKGHAVKIRSFRRAWSKACVSAGLGTFEPKLNPETGEPVLMKPRYTRSKPKVRMVYRGKLYHDLRRTGVRNLVRAGVSEKIAMSISGHNTRSVFDRYNITSGKDASEAGRKLAAFHESQKVGDNSGTNSTQTVITEVVSDTLQ